jgi:hypothetical protein
MYGRCWVVDDLVRQILAAIEETERRCDVVDDAPMHGVESTAELEFMRLAEPDDHRRRCAADRALITEITSMKQPWKHDECEASYYACAQAPAWDDSAPGAGCSDDDRAGQPCDCGRDARVRTVLTRLAEGYGVTDEPPEPGSPLAHELDAGLADAQAGNTVSAEVIAEDLQRRREAGEPGTVFLLLCRECTTDVPIPFDSAEARGKWAAGHRDATGHDTWWSHDHTPKGT